MRHFFDVPRGVREQALYTSFLNMVPGLLMAGARSPDPSQGARGYGMAVQGFGQGGQDYMNNWRNMQALGFATKKAQREEETAQARQRALQTLGRSPPGVVSESPEGERTAAFDPNDPDFKREQMAALMQLAPEQAAAQLFKPPVLSPFEQARQTALGRAAGMPGPIRDSYTDPAGVRRYKDTNQPVPGVGERPRAPTIIPPDPVRGGPSSVLRFGTTIADPINVQGLPDIPKTEIAESRSSITKSISLIDEVANSLDMLAKNPNATGIRGLIVEKVGGLLGQIDEGLDLGAAQNQSLRTNLAAMIGRLIPQITNDTSGRYTEGDMQRVQAAAQATNPTASVGQIKSALKEIQDIAKRGVVFDMGKLRSDIPAGSVRFLLDNPGMRDEFEQKYGVGAARTVLGR